MKINIYSKLSFLSNRIPLHLGIGLTGQNLILPFYHTVTNTPKPHLKHLGYYRTKDSFEKDIIFFKKYFNSIPIDEIDLQSKKKSFHITFDDGLSELMTEAIPFLKANHIHATIFVNSDFVDNKRMFYRHKISVLFDSLQDENLLRKTAEYLKLDLIEVVPYLEKLTFKDESKIDLIAQNIAVDFVEYLKLHQPYLTSNQLLQLIDMGFTIGNHGKSHPNFDEISLEEQLNEVQEGSNFLANLPFNITKNYFSFPFGSDNRSKEFYEKLYKKNKVLRSFGVSGLKKDIEEKHMHRIEMEHQGISGESIIKFEYFYYMIKSIFNKNAIKNRDNG